MFKDCLKKFEQKNDENCIYEEYRRLKITSVALATESSGYVWLRAPNGLVHILIVIRLEHKFGCFSVIVASKG